MNQPQEQEDQVEDYIPMDRLVIYSIAAFINCALFGQFHLIKTADRRRGCYSGTGGILKNYILPPLASLTSTLIYIMGNPCIKNLALDYIINFGLILTSWVAMLGLQFSIIVFHYNAQQTTTEKRILENKCSELQRYDLTAYYTQYNHYQTLRKCEITFLSLSAFLSALLLILQLIVTVNGSCMSNYGGWRTGIELIVIILFPSLNLTYYMKGVGKREECKKLKSINDKTISLTPSTENQKQVEAFI